MHMHTAASFDSLSDPEDVLTAATRRGIDRICITDHDEIHAALDLHARHPERVIVGEEIKTAQGVDIIGLFLEERIPGRTPARETCERIREQGGLVYVPHPFAGRKAHAGAILDEVGELVHVIEGFNGRIHLSQLNQRAIEWARARALPLGAGSDAHALFEVGRTFIELPHFDNDRASFLAALPDGVIHGHFSSWTVHLASTYAKIRKRLPARGGRR